MSAKLLTEADLGAIDLETSRRGRTAGAKLAARLRETRRAELPKPDPRQIDMFGGPPAQLELSTDGGPDV
jgi:hypothetical protein